MQHYHQTLLLPSSKKSAFFSKVINASNGLFVLHKYVEFVNLGHNKLKWKTICTNVDRKPGFSWNQVYGSKMVKEPRVPAAGSKFYYINSDYYKKVKYYRIIQVANFKIFM